MLRPLLEAAIPKIEEYLLRHYNIDGRILISINPPFTWPVEKDHWFRMLSLRDGMVLDGGEEMYMTINLDDYELINKWAKSEQ